MGGCVSALQKYEMKETLGGWVVQPPQWSQEAGFLNSVYIRLPTVFYSWVLKIFEEGDFTACLCDLIQYCTKVFLMPDVYLTNHSLERLLLVLQLFPIAKRLTVMVIDVPQVVVGLSSSQPSLQQTEQTSSLNFLWQAGTSLAWCSSTEYLPVFQHLSWTWTQNWTHIPSAASLGLSWSR